MLDIEQLKQENIKLKNTLDIILDNAKINEKNLKLFEKIEYHLMESKTMVELLNTLLLDYPKFFNISFSSLILTDSEQNIPPLLSENTITQQFHNRVAVLHMPMAIEPIQTLTHRIYLGEYNSSIHQDLIPNKSDKKSNIKSITILPLIRHKKIIGLFCGFSDIKNRFSSPLDANSCSDYMIRLGYIISLCIENVINNEYLLLSSLTDQLTKIRNRRYFDQSILEEVTRLQRYRAPLSCLLMDIDHFKLVNDQHGHAAGDQVLIQIVKRIKETLRKHEILARYGGEEFILLLPKTKNEEAFLLAQRINNAIKNRPIHADENKLLPITISIGLSTLDKDFASDKIHHYCQELVKQADNALYKAKETGRNKVCNTKLID